MSDLRDLPRLSDVAAGAVQAAKGLPFTRYAIALCRAKGEPLQAAVLAERAWPDMPAVARALKAAVNFGSTIDIDFAEPLVELKPLAAEFVSLVRTASVLGRMSASMRRVPFNIAVARQTSATTVGWVGQGAPKVVSELHLEDGASLGLAKIAGIVALSLELVRSSSPSAEQLVKADLVAALAQFADEQFLSPGVAAVANVSPASITNGLTPITSAGSSVANIVTDANAAIAQIIAGGSLLSAPFWIMRPATAAAIAGKFTGNVAAFPSVSPVSGGTLLGIPILLSNAVGGSTSGGSRLVLVDAAEVLLADDGQANVSVSGEAAIQLDSAPSSSASTLTSLWQNNLSAVRAERFINWAPRRSTGAAAYVDFVSYA